MQTSQRQLKTIGPVALEDRLQKVYHASQLLELLCELVVLESLQLFGQWRQHGIWIEFHLVRGIFNRLGCKPQHLDSFETCHALPE